jgi:microsomal dipeptidase-like Zn-dependent dipeptidase
MVLRRLLVGLALVLLVAGIGFFTVLAHLVDRSLNTMIDAPPHRVAAAAESLHLAATVVDLHTDALLWPRDLNDRHRHGHVDLPRLQDGNVAVQVFSVVTKTPRGINYERNEATTDNITLLAMAERYPLRAWRSLRERARWQATRLHDQAARSNGTLRVVRTRAGLREVLDARSRGDRVIAGILATEGLHPLEADVANLDTLFAAGFRMFGLTHFFDNEVGGSAHGTAKGGLTAFGREVIARAEALGATIDVAHASPKLFDDVLAATRRPLVVSHAGVQGTCAGPRNLSDAQLRALAAHGGLVGIGYWDGAICETSAASFGRAVAYAVKVAGEDHVALGSDFDGSTRTPFDAGGLAQVTEAMLNAGLSPDQVRKVLGGNAIRFLLANLPD